MIRHRLLGLNPTGCVPPPPRRARAIASSSRLPSQTPPSFHRHTT